MSEETREVNESLTLTKGSMDDWWLIERAEHDGRTWSEQIGPNAFALQCSSRISDADVEGTAEEMRCIADAIKRRSNVRFRRCGVSVEGDRAEFWSPRNSLVRASAPLAIADALAAQIERELP